MLLEMTLRRNKPSHSIPLSERSLEKKKEGRESGSADEASALAGFKGARSLWYAVFTAHARRAAIRRRRSILEGQILTAAFLSLSSLFYSPTLFLSLVLSLSSLLFSFLFIPSPPWTSKFTLLYPLVLHPLSLSPSSCRMERVYITNSSVWISAQQIEHFQEYFLTPTGLVTLPKKMENPAHFLWNLEII